MRGSLLAVLAWRGYSLLALDAHRCSGIHAGKQYVTITAKHCSPSRCKKL
jgi:hypothetical protein